MKLKNQNLNEDGSYSLKVFREEEKRPEPKKRGRKKKDVQ